jgi:acetyltransferase-like isoleucine patch superfamily enzyme
MPGSTVQPNGSRGEGEGLFSQLLTNLNSLWVAATYPFAGGGRGVEVHYASEISRHLAPRISLGSEVKIGKHAWLTCGMEDEHEVKITIEDNCRIGPQCTISSKNSIHLERDVFLAPDVLIQDHAHAYEDVSRPPKFQGPTEGGRIRIEEGCRIGEGAAILCGRGKLVLGRNCTVEPGAVVIRSFPPNSVIAGNPARLVRSCGANPAPGGREPLGAAEAELAKREG